MSHVRLVAMFSLGALISACGVYRNYALPVAAADAPRTFAPIEACANQRDLQAHRFEDSVNVRVDDATWVYYQIQHGKKFEMVLVVDDEKVPANKQDEKFSETKKIADEIYNCAMEAMKVANQALHPVVQPTP